MTEPFLFTSFECKKRRLQQKLKPPILCKEIQERVITSASVTYSHRGGASWQGLAAPESGVLLVSIYR